MISHSQISNRKLARVLHKWLKGVKAGHQPPNPPRKTSQASVSRSQEIRPTLTFEIWDGFWTLFTLISRHRVCALPVAQLPSLPVQEPSTTHDAVGWLQKNGYLVVLVAQLTGLAICRAAVSSSGVGKRWSTSQQWVTFIQMETQE